MAVDTRRARVMDFVRREREEERQDCSSRSKMLENDMTRSITNKSSPRIMRWGSLVACHLSHAHPQISSLSPTPSSEPRTSNSISPLKAAQNRPKL